MAMLMRVFPPAERMRTASILTVPTTLAPTIGPVLGGLLVTGLSWRWVFYLNLPIGAAALLFGLLCLRPDGEGDAGRFDLPGFLLCGAGLALLLYGLSAWPEPGPAATSAPLCVAAGALQLAVTVVVELRTRAPTLDLGLLAGRLFRWSTSALMLASVAFFGTLYAVSVYFQAGRGLSALASGLSTFPEALGAMCGAQVASRVLHQRLGPRRHISLGLLATGVSIGLLAVPSATTSLWWTRILLFGVGFSMAQLFTTTQTVAFADIPAHATGRASAMFNAGRQLGSAAGVALLSATIATVGPVRWAVGSSRTWTPAGSPSWRPRSSASSASSPRRAWTTPPRRGRRRRRNDASAERADQRPERGLSLVGAGRVRYVVDGQHQPARGDPQSRRQRQNVLSGQHSQRTGR
jgi:MFS family permease